MALRLRVDPGAGIPGEDGKVRRHRFLVRESLGLVLAEEDHRARAREERSVPGQIVATIAQHFAAQSARGCEPEDGRDESRFELVATPPHLVVDEEVDVLGMAGEIRPGFEIDSGVPGREALFAIRLRKHRPVPVARHHVKLEARILHEVRRHVGMVDEAGTEHRGVRERPAVEDVRIAHHSDREAGIAPRQGGGVHVDAAPDLLQRFLQEQEPHLESGDLGSPGPREVPGLAQEAMEPAIAANEGVAIDVLEEEQDVLVERERHRAREVSARTSGR